MVWRSRAESSPSSYLRQFSRWVAFLLAPHQVHFLAAPLGVVERLAVVLLYLVLCLVARDFGQPHLVAGAAHILKRAEVEERHGQACAYVFAHVVLPLLAESGHGNAG